MPLSQNRATDPRGFQRQLERELIAGGLLIGLFVGVGLILLLWGQTAALTSLFCFGLFLGIIALVWALLTFFEWLGRRD